LRWCASGRPCSDSVRPTPECLRGRNESEETMAGVWKKTMQYLGLVEDEEYEDVDAEPDGAESPPVRRYSRQESSVGTDTLARPEAVVRTMPHARAPALASIHRAEPKRFN